MNPGNDQDTGANDDLFLCVTCDSPRSLRARANLAKALEEMAIDRITVRHIDLLEDTEAISQYGIFATPVLIRPRGSGGPAALYSDLSNETELQRFLANLRGQSTA